MYALSLIKSQCVLVTTNPGAPKPMQADRVCYIITVDAWVSNCT